MTNSTKTTSSGSTENSIADRFRAAVDLRLKHSAITYSDLAVALGMADRTLLAKRNGENKLFYQDIEAADDFFASVGLPGLMDDMRGQRAWANKRETVNREALSAPARKLLDCLGGLHAAGAGLQSFLAEQRLLPHVHIMARADNAVRIVHCGERMASAKALSRSILLRDVREISDRPYGLFLHEHVSQLLQAGEPAAHRITAPTMRYRRFSVVTGDFLIAVSDDISVDDSYLLQ
jgi:hypothetical protein